MKPFYCWNCKYFKPVGIARSGRCHRYAPHSLDYYGLNAQIGFKYLTHGVSEDESSTDGFCPVEKLSVTFNALEGATYRISYYHEIGITSPTGDIGIANAQVQIDNALTISDADYDRVPDAVVNTNYGENTGGYYLTNTLSAGSHHVDIDYRARYGTTAFIRRARILIEQMLDSAIIDSTTKFALIEDAGPGSWCGQYRDNNAIVPPIPAP